MISITQATTFGYFNPSSKINGIIALFQNMIMHIIVWIEAEHILYLICFIYPIIMKDRQFTLLIS